MVNPKDSINFILQTKAIHLERIRVPQEGIQTKVYWFRCKVLTQLHVARYLYKNPYTKNFAKDMTRSRSTSTQSVRVWTKTKIDF
jgi:hypothetical protein